LRIRADISKENKIEEVAMKSPWQIGLLAIAVTGVSTYDYMFFKNRNVQKTPITEIHVSSPISSSAEPLLAPLPEPTGSEKAMGVEGENLRPAISLDELNVLSRQAFVIKEDLESNNISSMPMREPASKRIIAGKHARSLPPIVENDKDPVLNIVPAPQCKFSGTMIEGRKKVALVNGMPLMVGDRLGVWQLARIESDYIVLESGAKSHRIELNRMEIRSVPRKDPS
jgi:hypothetical protein